EDFCANANEPLPLMILPSMILPLCLSPRPSRLCGDFPSLPFCRHLSAPPFALVPHVKSVSISVNPWLPSFGCAPVALCSLHCNSLSCSQAATKFPAQLPSPLRGERARERGPFPRDSL